MLLVIDVGNTHIVFGIYEKDKLIYDWRIATEKQRTSDEYGLLFNEIFKYNDIDKIKIEDIIISSVVPTVMTALMEMSERYFGKKPIVIGPGVKTGINIRYDNPKEVGADRIVNAVGAYHKYKGPLIIVDFGTAVTFCAVSKNGDYLGGAIVPGLSISSEALFLRAAKLPKVEIKKPSSIIGKTTVNSIQSGLIYGYTGLVEYMVDNMKKEMREPEAKVIATGGFSKVIGKETKSIDIIDKMLTLEGLRIIYERNK